MSQPKYTVHLSFIVLVLFGSLVDYMTLVHFGDGNLHTVYQFKYYSVIDIPLQMYLKCFTNYLGIQIDMEN